MPTCVCLTTDQTDLLYQRDGETMAIVRPDLVVSETGSSVAVLVVDIRAVNAVGWCCRASAVARRPSALLLSCRRFRHSAAHRQLGKRHRFTECIHHRRLCGVQVHKVFATEALLPVGKRFGLVFLHESQYSRKRILPSVVSRFEIGALTKSTRSSEPLPGKPDQEHLPQHPKSFFWPRV